MASIGDGYWLQVSGAANQGPSSFKEADYVPPEILNDIPLLDSAKFPVQFAKTLRLMKSYIPQLQRLLNQDARK